MSFITVERKLLAAFSTQVVLSSAEVHVLLTETTCFELFGRLLLQQLRAAGYAIVPIVLASGEKSKSLEAAAHCWQEMSQAGCSRSSCLLALGGGVVGDLAGFVAGCYHRGIEHLLIPTTLVAMIDAAIGGKAAINFGNLKNNIGLFKSPKAIFVDPDCLNSLPAKEYTAGLIEIVKIAFAYSEKLVLFLEEQITAIQNREVQVLDRLIRWAIELKAEIVAKDWSDSLGIRAILNYGHTFAHAIEAVSEFTISHGEAVAIGLSCAAHLAHHCELVSSLFIARQEQLCHAIGASTRFPAQLNPTAVVSLMHKDKKSPRSAISCILPTRIGETCFRKNISPKQILAALEKKDLYDRALLSSGNTLCS